MISTYREAKNLFLAACVVLAGHGVALARSVPHAPPGTAPVQVISIGESVRVTGLITVEPDPAPIGYPGPILTDLETRLFERVSEGAAPRPITQLLLLFMPGRPAEGAPVVYRVTVTGRYVRLLGAPSLTVTSIVVEAGGESTRLRRKRFDALHVRVRPSSGPAGGF